MNLTVSLALAIGANLLFRVNGGEDFIQEYFSRFFYTNKLDIDLIFSYHRIVHLVCTFICAMPL